MYILWEYHHDIQADLNKIKTHHQHARMHILTLFCYTYIGQNPIIKAIGAKLKSYHGSCF